MKLHQKDDYTRRIIERKEWIELIDAFRRANPTLNSEKLSRCAHVICPEDAVVKTGHPPKLLEAVLKDYCHDLYRVENYTKP